MVPSQLRIIYRAAAGRYRLRRVEGDGKWLNFLTNNAGKKGRTTNAKAVHPRAPPFSLSEWFGMSDSAASLGVIYIYTASDNSI
jgi:hypothetical protein